MLDTLYLTGIVLALIIHIIALRATTWATDRDYLNQFKLTTEFGIWAIYIIRFLVWLLWGILAINTDNPIFVAMFVTGFALFFMHSLLLNKSDREIKRSKFLSFLDKHKLLPLCYNRLPPAQ